MANDIVKPKGPTNASKPTSGGAVAKMAPLIGIVKDNIDPIRSGRIRVYLRDFSGQNENDSNNWITVNYMSPFYGLTKNNSSGTGYGTYKDNSNSYGMWYSPPDLGTQVVCIFINGDQNFGYWIGCIPEPEALQMVPAIGGVENVTLNSGEANSYGGATKLPVTNINTNNSGINDSSGFLDSAKPVHSYVAQSLFQQGLIRDTLRGVVSTSAQRETPSRVGWGVSTPGRPIYDGGHDDQSITTAAADPQKSTTTKVVGRRGGHSVVLDDGDIIGKDNMVRIRTSLGHQILMSDDGQTLFIIHANGQSWVEMGKEGTIDMYATNSVNVRTQGDLNLHADNNINIHAKKKLNVYSENFNLNSDKESTIRIGADLKSEILGNYSQKVDKKMSFLSTGESSFASQSTTYINGSKINLNTGSSSLTPEEVKPLPLTAHTDTLFDSSKGWAPAPGLLLSVTSRAPAHSPWAMANQGVDIKVNNDASSVLPNAPAAAVTATNQSVPAVPSIPVATSVASTVPIATSTDGSIDKNAASGIIGQVAAIAATNPLTASAVAAGSGIVSTVNGAVAAIGKTALTPNQLETAGAIKPGSSVLVNTLVQAGKTLESALPNTMFTGIPGAENLSSLVNNLTPQSTIMVSNINQAQSLLSSSGIITGKESASQVSGLITATATSGAAAVNGLISNASNTVSSLANNVSSVANNISNTPNSLLGSASSMLSAGNFAGSLAQNVNSGLSSISTSLSGITSKLSSSISSVLGSISGGVSGLLDNAKGIAGSAFSAIVKSFPALQSGIPQNLAKIAGQSVNALGSANNGLSALPGGQQAVSVVKNNISGLVSSVPGISSISSNFNNVAGMLSGGLNSITSSLPTSATASLQAALSSLSSGGPIQIKLPSVAINTINRDSITASIKTVISDPKIPAPQYNGVSDQSIQSQDALLQKLQAANSQLDTLNSQLEIEQAKFNDINKQLTLAKQTLPAGDQQIQSLKQQLVQQFLVIDDITKKISKIANSVQT